MTWNGCMRMRMRRRSDAFPHVFTSYSFARMGASEGSGTNMSEKGRRGRTIHEPMRAGGLGRTRVYT
jgi:hypothetical protein